MSERQTEGHRRQEDNESAEKVKTNVSGRAGWLFSGFNFLNLNCIMGLNLNKIELSTSFFSPAH